MLRICGFALTVLIGAFSGLEAQTTSLAVSQNVLFPNANNLDASTDAVAIAPDGSWMIAIASNGALDDVIITEFDDCGAAIFQYGLLFPSSVNVSFGNVGVVMAENGRFAALIGSGGLGDLVIIRRDASGFFGAVLVDYPGSSVPALDSRPVIPASGDYVCSIGSGGAQDLVFTPIGEDMQGVVTPGTPVGVSFPSANGISLTSGIRPAILDNGRAVAIAGAATLGDIVVVEVPSPFSAGGLVATNIAYPNNGFLPDPGAPILASPAGNYFATYGSTSVGDIVVIPISAGGTPGAAQGVLFPGGNNADDTSAPLATGWDGRVIGTRGTLTAGDLVLVPVSAGGVAGSAVNVAYPASNFVPADAGPVLASPTGTFFLTAGSQTIGDAVVTSVSYNATANSVTAVARNRLFISNANRRLNAEFAIAPDGSAIATYGSAGQLDDLIVVAVDDEGIPGSAYSVVFPGSINVPAFSIRPVFDPGSDWIACPGDNTAGDLVLTSLKRDSNADVEIRTLETQLFSGFNNFNASDRALLVAPSGQFLVARGSPTIGDLVVIPFDDARVYALTPMRLGTDLFLRFHSPQDGGLDYAAGISTGRYEGFALDMANTHIVELVLDDLLRFSLNPLNMILFPGFRGTLNPDGVATGSFYVPDLPILRGSVLYTSFLTLNPADADGIERSARTRSLIFR